MDRNFDMKQFTDMIKRIEATEKAKKDNAYKEKIQALIDELSCEIEELKSLRHAIIATYDSKVKNSEMKLNIYKEEMKKLNGN